MSTTSPTAGESLTDGPVLTELPVSHLFDMSLDLETARVIPTAGR